MLLNLGCGNEPLPKPWHNVDIKWYPGHSAFNPAREDKDTDYDWVQGDMRDLSDYADDSCERVNLCHSLEHVCLEDARKVLKEVCRVLTPGGEVQIEVPDLELALQNQRSNGEVMDLIYGGQGQATYTEGHYCGFIPVRLQQEMIDVGLKYIEGLPVGFGTSRPEPDKNFRLRGVK